MLVTIDQLENKRRQFSLIVGKRRITLQLHIHYLRVLINTHLSFKDNIVQHCSLTTLLCYIGGYNHEFRMIKTKFLNVDGLEESY